MDEALGLKLKGSGASAFAIELAKRAAAGEQVEPTRRFDRSQDGVEQQAAAQNPA